ncbi:hypothetical protein ACS0TY_034964 [Phlomoides rotata]
MSNFNKPLYSNVSKIINIDGEKNEVRSKDFRERSSGAWPEGVKKVAPPPEKKPAEDINDSADAFIKKFRQQLLLQRLESIENYEQMLKRGT